VRKKRAISWIWLQILVIFYEIVYHSHNRDRCDAVDFDLELWMRHLVVGVGASLVRQNDDS